MLVAVAVAVEVFVGVDEDVGVGVAGLFRLYVSMIAPVRVINWKVIRASVASTSIAP